MTVAELLDRVPVHDKVRGLRTVTKGYATITLQLTESNRDWLMARKIRDENVAQGVVRRVHDLYQRSPNLRLRWAESYAESLSYRRGRYKD